jgi:hypothetical protein
MSCLTSDELLLAIAGTEPDHVQTCATCRDELTALRAVTDTLAEPTQQDVQDAARITQSVLAKIAASTPRKAGGTPAVARMWFAPLALAAVAALGIGVQFRARDSIQARGSHTAESTVQALARRTGVVLYRLDETRPIAIERGERLSPRTAFVAGYRNIDREGSEYFTALLVDAKGETHWLYPGFGSADETPSSIKLTPSKGETLLSSSVSFEDLPPGEARIVMIRTRAPIDVRALDAIQNPSLTTLSSRYADSVLDELHVTF